MPILLELAQPNAAYAFQEQIEARVLFRRGEGEPAVSVPQPLQHPEVLTLRLRHQDGAREDRSPRPHGPLPPPPAQVLQSDAEEEAVALAFAPPSRPGEWATELEVRIGDRREVAPETRFTVLPPAALAVAAVASVHQARAADRILVLAADGALLEHPLLRHGPGEVDLGFATRLDTVPGPPAGLLAAAALPGVSNRPFWLVFPKGRTATARWYGEPRAEVGLELAPADSAPPVWLGTPLQVDDAGRLLLAWANGPHLRAVWAQPSGKASAPLGVALPGEIERGAAVGAGDGSVTLFLQVSEPPQPIPPGAQLLRVGSTEDLPDPGSSRSRMVFPKGMKPRSAPPPKHRSYLWAVRAAPGAALGAPVRVAALPDTNVALLATSAAEGEPAVLWCVERSGAAVQATRLALAPGKAGLAPQAAARKPVRLSPKHSTDPVALAPGAAGELELAFLEPKALVLASTAAPATSLPVKGARPSFVGLVAGQVLTFDTARGLVLGP